MGIINISDYPVSQLFVGTERPREEKLNPPDPEIERIKRRGTQEGAPQQRVRRMKPTGAGLWTSTETDNGNSAWLEFAAANPNLLSGDEQVWRVTPSNETNIYEINELEDLQRIAEPLPAGVLTFDEMEESDPSVDSAGLPRHAIDFAELAVEVDGVWLTKDAVKATHDPNNRPRLLAWDFESTIWLRWSFTNVELIGEVQSLLE